MYNMNFYPDEMDGADQIRMDKEKRLYEKAKEDYFAFKNGDVDVKKRFYDMYLGPNADAESQDFLGRFLLSTELKDEMIDLGDKVRKYIDKMRKEYESEYSS